MRRPRTLQIAAFALIAAGGIATGARAATPAEPHAAASAAAPAGLRYLGGRPALVAFVQLTTVDRLVKMVTGGEQSDAADAMAGMLALLKDQIDGPLAVGFYMDAQGKPESFAAAVRLKQAALTRELLNGAATAGSEESAGPRKTQYRGQTLITLNLPKAPGAGVPIPLQPTYTITENDFLVIGSTVDRTKEALDAAAESPGGPADRAGLTRMLQQFPLAAGPDVWLYVAKPSGPLALPGRTPIALAGLPIGPSVVTLRFTPAGVRFEGLATVDRTKMTRATP